LIPVSKARGEVGRERGRERREGKEEVQGKREGEWGSPTHYFRLKSCIVFSRRQATHKQHAFLLL